LRSSRPYDRAVAQLRTVPVEDDDAFSVLFG